MRNTYIAVLSAVVVSAPAFLGLASEARAESTGADGGTEVLADISVYSSAHILADSTTKSHIDDPTIVAIFDAANTVDIEMGKLAEERAQHKEVRDFGLMLERDHKYVRQLGRDLAKKLGVTPTPPANDPSAKAHAKAMQTLRATKASEFDHAFLQHEIAFHKAVIDAINTTLMPAITNEELKALVKKVAPAFEGHMLAAQTLDQKLIAHQLTTIKK